jgi:serine/threonine protein kinase
LSEENRRLANRYQLTARIGGGAMGVVWQAQDEHLGRTVAVKELLLQHGLDEFRADEAKKRAIREGRNAALLHHPNTITVFDVVEEADRPWLIMEYLPSQSLSTELTQRERLPVDEVVRIGALLASAFDAAHRVGLVHRDIKPGNVLLGSDGRVKVTDFGISRAVDDATITATGQIAGTPAFLPPEVARGEDATFASDVFSLGATLYAAVEGGPPFGYADNVIGLLHRVATGQTIPPSNAGLLTPVLTSMLAPRPEDRPSMSEVAAWLGRLRAGETPAPSSSVPTPSAQSRPASPPPASSLPASSSRAALPAKPRDRRILAAVLAVVAVLGAGTLIFLLNQDGSTPQAATPQASGPQASGPQASGQGSKSRATQQAPAGNGQPAPVSPPASTPARTSQQAPPPSESPEAAINSYYALLPGNLQAGYARLTDRFKQSRAQSFESYRSFWSQMRSVQVSGVTSSGPDTVSADVTYIYPNGRTTQERQTYTLVRDGGQWAIDSQQSG